MLNTVPTSRRVKGLVGSKPSTPSTVSLYVYISDGSGGVVYFHIP